MQYPVCVLIFWFMSPFNWKRYIWSFFPANSFMILTLKNNKRIDCTRQSLDLSLASAVLGETDPRFVPILQSPLQLQPPRPSLCHPLLPTTVNTRFCGWLLVPSQPWAPRYTRIIPKRSKLQSPTWSTCICGLPVHLSLGFHSNCKSVAGPGGTGKCKGAIHL